ncbi:MAG: glycosyltransferase [Chloroflexi bacterium]|nr:glycosyltransferase [Chloroflexota bacterium]
MAGKIAYIMSRFPHLPETFILREMNALEDMGWDIALYPLILQEQSVLHEESKVWVERAHYAPFLSWQVVRANLLTFIQMPFRYFGTLLRTVIENIPSPKFAARALILFPKAVLMAHLMQREGVEHIHAHYATHPALVAWIIHRLSGLSYSVTVHAHDIFVVKTMLKTKLGAASFIAAISEFNRDFLADLVGENIREKTYIIHCGIVPAWYSKDSVRTGGSKGTFEILNISSLQPYKGQLNLLKACSILKEWGIPFRCRIIGEGEERDNLEEFIRANGLSEDVFLLGALSQEKVAQILQTVDCYVQPSVIAADGKMEGIPVAIMEALATGLAVIATNISGIPELIRSGETGLLVPPGDAPALASAIMEMFQSKKFAKQLAVEGKKLVLKEFDLYKNVAQLALQFQYEVARV